MKIKKTTQQHINKIIEFHQAILTLGFGQQRDVLSEVLASICSSPSSSKVSLRGELFYLAAKVLSLWDG